jgi:hypothetical protein
MSRSTGSLSFVALLTSLILPLPATTVLGADEPARLRGTESAQLLASPNDPSGEPGEVMISDAAPADGTKIRTRDLTDSLMAVAREASEKPWPTATDQGESPVAAPSIAAPSVAAPSIAAPSIAAPSIAAPSIAAPSIAAPSIAAPSVEGPLLFPMDMAMAVADKRSDVASKAADAEKKPADAAEKKAEKKSSGMEEKSSSVKVDGPVINVESPRPTSKPADAGDQPVAGPSLGLPAASPADIKPKTNSSPSKVERQQVKPIEQPKAVERPGDAKEAKTPAKKSEKKSDQFELPKSPRQVRKAELSETMTAVRDRVRWVLANYFQQTFNTRDNTPADILLACMAYGCQTEVIQGNDKINGITVLCWNYPCAGYELLRKVDQHIAPRVGYGLQERPGQFLAVLALSRVPGDYPIRVGKDTRTVADLVEHEKLCCRSGGDQSLRLLGIGHYVTPQESWKNDQGESWTVERLAKEELGQPVPEAAFGGTQRLLGLSYAMARQRVTGGVYTEVERFLKEFRGFAYRIQNSNGSWHPLYFSATGTNNDSISQLRATAHVLQWLAVSQPESAMDDARLIKAVEYVNTYLINQNGRWSVPSLDAQTIDAVTCSLSALTLYDERAFKPFDEEPKPEKAGSSAEGKTARQ